MESESESTTLGDSLQQLATGTTVRLGRDVSGGTACRSDPAAGEEDALDCGRRFFRLLPTRQANHFSFADSPVLATQLDRLLENTRYDLMHDLSKNLCF